MAENMVIKELLDQPFCKRPLRYKLRILNKGPPTPLLPSVITHYKTKNIIRDIFASLNMKKVVWVAGCATANKL
jgi:hypothetical protein